MNGRTLYVCGQILMFNLEIHWVSDEKYLRSFVICPNELDSGFQISRS